MIVERHCVECGCEYLPEQPTQKYCSKVCKGRAQNRRYYEHHTEAMRNRMRQNMRVRRANKTSNLDISETMVKPPMWSSAIWEQLDPEKVKKIYKNYKK